MSSSNLANDTSTAASRTGSGTQSGSVVYQLDTASAQLNTSGQAATTLQPTTYLEGAGSSMLGWTLAAIVGVSALFIASWWWSLPGPSEVASYVKTFAPSNEPTKLTPEQIIDLVSRMRASHTELYKSMIQMVVLSVLLPIFTLVAGYVWGSNRSAAISPKQP
jgi:hypothetical protein